ncbi:MAG: hypothetical protein KGJ23_06525 [Euryarchaeota archaeon]|nr:hypothetical protein [Euryarchaeota archaeon]MDE1836256.1 hypothetical protein [Euryarchaeota archaeon]MDE1882196.1 hypothetical protein [Euryarchaeota archaeon]MDE2044983.1 hypothetical protein [Thermoplasmata archaeon]
MGSEERTSRDEGDGRGALGRPEVLGSFEHAGTGTVHIVMTDRRTLCGARTGAMDLRGNDDWYVREEDAPVSCLRCQGLALKSPRI